MAYRGRPILSLRLPRKYIAGLQILAREQNTTVSDIIRDMVKATLDEHHITTAPQPIEGQLHV